MKKFFLVFLILFLIAVGPISSQSMTIASGDGDIIVDFSVINISGNILDKATGEPIVGAQVSFIPSWGPFGPPPMWDPSAVAISNEDGFYSFDFLLPPDRTDIVVSASGYQETKMLNVGLAPNSNITINFLLEKKIDPLIVIPGAMGSWKVGDIWYLDPIMHTYDNLWEALKNADYQENKNLFTFLYDWRDSNITNADLLRQKIQKVKNICNCDKVDIVAHSMGGLVTRAYAQGDSYNNDIDQLIFLATPHKGAPKAYLVWESGEFGIDHRDNLKEKIFELEAEAYNYKDIFHYIRWRPVESAKELLPVYDYLQYEELTQPKPYPVDYPRNTFLEKLNEQNSLDKLNNIDITNIVASAGEKSTINSFKIMEADFPDGKWEHGYPKYYDLPLTDRGLIYGSGDITVPKESNGNFLGLEDVLIISTHNDIVTDAQKQIIKELTGTLPTVEVKKQLSEKFLIFRIFSPADFTVIAPDGKRLGKNFDSNKAINEIQGAFYSGFDSDIEFAVVPDPMDGEYKVELQGTGEGEFRLSVSHIDELKDIDKDFIGLIKPDQKQEFDFVYSNSGDEIVASLAKKVIIKDVIEDIETIYNKRWLKEKRDKKTLTIKLNILAKKLKRIEKQIELAERLIQKIENNNKIKDRLKKRIVNKFNKRIDKLFIRKQKIINKDLNSLKKKLDKIKNKERINKKGYDLLISDINYLKINL